MSQPQKFVLNDSFENWSQKYNALVDGIISNQNFEYLKDNTVGRVIQIAGGKVRDASVITTIPLKSITIPINTEVVVGVAKVAGVSDLQTYVLNSQPNDYFVPLYTFKTDGYNVVSYTDLRTQVSYGSGGASSGSTSQSVALFDIHIATDLTIPAGKNALSIDPIVDSGKTVTVTNGSTWVIL